MSTVRHCSCPHYSPPSPQGRRGHAEAVILHAEAQRTPGVGRSFWIGLAHALGFLALIGAFVGAAVLL